MLIPFGLEADADYGALKYLDTILDSTMHLFRTMFPNALFPTLPKHQQIGAYIIVVHLLAHFWHFTTELLRSRMATDGAIGAHPPSLARAWHCTFRRRSSAEPATEKKAIEFALAQLEHYAISSNQEAYAPFGPLGLEALKDDMLKMMVVWKKAGLSAVPYSFVEMP